MRGQANAGGPPPDPGHPKPDGAAREWRFEVDDEAATVELARRLGRQLGGRGVVALHGELGAGKTRFAQGLALAMGVAEPVCSPTFTLVNEHAGADGRRFLHLDLYRLADESAVEDLGFEELLERGTLVAVEWPERAGALLPAGTVHVWLEAGGTDEHRRIRILTDDTTAPQLATWRLTSTDNSLGGIHGL